MFNNLKNYRAERARRKMLSRGRKKSAFRKWRFLAISIVVLALSAAVYAICFAYKSPVMPHILAKNKIAQVQIVSPFDFSYVSEIQTQSSRDRSAEKIPPLYRINPEIAANGAAAVKGIAETFAAAQEKYDDLSAAEKKSGKFFEEISSEIRKRSRVEISPDDVRTIYERTNAENRARAFNQAFFHAKNILRDGVYSDQDSVFAEAGAGAAPRADISGGVSALQIRAVGESAARRELLEKIKMLGMGDPLAYAVYRAVNQTLSPNIEFDEERTKQRRDEARAAVKPVVVKIRAGETLVDSDTAPTPIVSEKIRAYKAELEKGGHTHLFYRGGVDYIFCLLLVISATLFIVISRSQKNKNPRTMAIFCTLLLMNLVIERILIETSSAEYYDENTPLLQILAYVAPIMLGPMIMVLLFGSYTGFIMALMVSALTTLMLGEGIVYFLIFLSSALVAIYFCANAETRAQAVLGGAIYGLFISGVSFVMGYCLDLPISVVWRQAVLAISGGAMTGFVAIGLLPALEKIFNRYSNITLLDYTDLNNPLLRRMQIEAPGTYHHSVMVSYLAEAAAVAVGANSMVCRVGALYHDIGKISKPEFFSENQGGGKNAHDDQNPSMSALIIKNHIREGADMAKIAKLPKQIVDAIEQHHGTSIISYFYNKAMKLAEAGGAGTDPVQALRAAGIDESTYRHEGTKPQTVEAAIIMIADSCEAASRSLKRITQHGVEDLVDAIVRGKTNDGQLDECPITIKQISKIKESVVFTMMNMLHSRVAYKQEENNEKK
ncbi:MAG: HDIG domain-containing protein [Opitutales bacterium]|nr:HDIG domain-containing protein [Opitutales bacterium]